MFGPIFLYSNLIQVFDVLGVYTISIQMIKTFWISDLENSPASHLVLSLAKVFPVTDSVLGRDAGWFWLIHIWSSPYLFLSSSMAWLTSPLRSILAGNDVFWLPWFYAMSDPRRERKKCSKTLQRLYVD